jgi:predicted RNA-binding protein (virulence factor B family)
MQPGIRHRLTTARFTKNGAYLTDEVSNEVLLPNKYLTEELSIGDELDVFVYKDSEDRLIATTLKPALELNQYAYLFVKQVNVFGAFLDWNLEKDLLVPFREQHIRMQENRSYLVTLRLDSATQRLYATSKTKRFLSLATKDIELGEERKILICDQTGLGFRVIVDDLYIGMLYHQDIAGNLNSGDIYRGHIYHVREDGKVDVRLGKTGRQKYESAAEILLDILKIQNTVPLGDASDPDDIRERFGMSKKTFKQAAGQLMKAKKIIVSPYEIKLL